MFSTYTSQEDENITFDEGNPEPSVPLHFPEYDEFAERIRKTLYYGALPSDERPSLPMSEIAVGFFRDAAPKELGKADVFWASDVGRKAFISPCSMMLSMIYIERLKHKNPEYLLTTSSSDLFLISMMVASKFLYDEGVDEEVYNEEWAESAAMETADVNQLERDFLTAIDWSLFAEKEDFERVLKSMEERIAMSQGLDRGSWSYSDILVLLSNAKLQDSLRHVLEETLKVMLVCSVAYTAGGGTVLASMATLDAIRSHVSLSGLRSDPHNYPVSREEVTNLLNAADMSNNKNVSEITREGMNRRSSLMNRKLEDIHGLDLSSDRSEFESKEDHTGRDHTEGGSIPGNETGSLVDSVGSDYHVAMQYGLSFPSFLTLALIKDTVSYVFGGEADLGLVSGKEGQQFVDRGDENHKTKRSPCSCPTCPLLSRRGASRRRKWIKGQWIQNRPSFLQCVFNPPMGLWGSLVQGTKRMCCHGKRKGQGQDTLEQMGRSGRKGGGNSGKVGSNAEKQGDCAEEIGGVVKNGGSGGGNFVLESKKKEVGSDLDRAGDKCGVMDGVKWKHRVLLPCRVESNYIELTSRLATSAQFAITR